MIFMSITAQLAKQLRAVYSGGNWTGVCLKDALTGVTWQQATQQVNSFNTIAKLVYHINYYVDPICKVMQGYTLNAHDKYSFDCPPITSEKDWEHLVNKLWADGETLASLIEKLPDSKLTETFADEKYGTYLRNLTGVIEHIHYHLGQIVIIKKLI
jgi:hypothetical protein